MIFRAPSVFGLLFVVAAWSQQYGISTVAGGATPPTPSPAARASIGDPARVATDSAGNVYFASLHSVFRVDRSGTLTRIAGNGHAGYSGDNGPAANAQFLTPDSIAIDSSGNLFVSDPGANVVRKISGGNVTTLAGNGLPGYLGDGGPASLAELSGPTGIAVDASGNVYVADTDNAVIRRITPDGTISTVAGTGTAGYNGDGIPAASAMLNVPQGVAADAAGNVYVADTDNHRVRQISTNGTISTAAGTGLATYSGDNIGGTGITSSSGDNGPATKSSVVLPTAVAADSSGNLYIADYGNSKIRVVSKGIIQSLTGGGEGEAPIDGQAAVSIRLNGPTGVAVDPSGTVYLTEGSIGSGSGLSGSDFRVWKISTTGIFSVLAGTGSANYSGDGSSAAAAQFNLPGSAAIDPAGNLFVADALNNRIRKITPGGAVSTVAGTGVAGYSGDGSSALNAQLNGPMGVAVDAFGDIFIADTRNNRIRKVTNTGIIYTVVGNGNAGFFGDGGVATSAAVHSPQGVFVDAAGNIWVADTANHRVRMATQTLTINTVAGSGRPGFSGDGGPALNAQLKSPAAVALDSAGNVYIADRDNNRVRLVKSDGTISTLAGNATSAGIGDGGPSPAAQLSLPQGVAVDGAGNVFIADTGHNRIREVFPSGGIVTIAGNGTCCYSGDGGPAAIAQINAPLGIALDGAGNVLFADTGNNSLRFLQPLPATSAITSIVNAASGAAGAIAPGEIVTIYGSGLGPPQIAPAQLNSDGLVDTQLAGASVSFNGIAAPLVYASNSQVSAIVPYAISGTSAQVTVQYQNQTAAQLTVPIAAASPALFTVDSSGRGQALAVNQDGFANTVGHPTQTATLLTLYATGGGLTSPDGVDGQIVGTILPAPLLPVTVTIGGKPAQVIYAAGAPGLVSGIMQIVVQVPTGIPVGNAVPVGIKVGDFSGPPGVTIAVTPF